MFYRPRIGCRLDASGHRRQLSCIRHEGSWADSGLFRSGLGPRSPSAGSLALAARILRSSPLKECPWCSVRARVSPSSSRFNKNLGIRHPFVCENGGALFIPRTYVDFAVPHAREIAGYQAVEFGRPYAEVVDALRRTADQTAIDIVGFSDMSVDEVARECQITLLHARLAKLREYDEPFRIVDPNPKARARLLKALSATRLQCSRLDHLDRVGGVVAREMVMKRLCSLVRRTTESRSRWLWRTREPRAIFLDSPTTAFRCRTTPRTSRAFCTSSPGRRRSEPSSTDWVARPGCPGPRRLESPVRNHVTPFGKCSDT